MTAFALKPRQRAARDAVFAKLAQGVARQLVALPTGTGKTVLACDIAREFPRALFLCHRQELVEQTARTMSRLDPDRAQGRIVQGEHRLAAFTVGMMQTVHRRLDRLDPTAFDLIVIDEAHHAAAKTWRTVADHFKPRLRLGLSATPERADGAKLSNLFDEIVYQMGIADAVEERLLSPPTCLLCRTATDLSDVHTLGGDFNEGELQEVVNTPRRNRYIVEKYHQHASGRRAVAFTAGVQHARDLAGMFRDAGLAADWVSGDDPDRSGKLAAFAAGEIAVLANAMILTEGWDDPGVEAVLMARPTKSRSLYAQMIGRGLRLNAGKQDCLIVDFVDNAGRHNLVAAWKFLGMKKPPATEVPEHWRPGNTPGEAKVDATPVEIERVIDLLKPPPAQAFAYGEASWHYAPATEKQLAVLESRGYDVVGTDWTRGQASGVIASLPPSPRQLRALKAHGYDVTVEWTRQQANVALDDAAKRIETAIDRIRRAGFEITATGRRLTVQPEHRLSGPQREWIAARQAAIIAHMSAASR